MAGKHVLVGLVWVAVFFGLAGCHQRATAPDSTQGSPPGEPAAVAKTMLPEPVMAAAATAPEVGNAAAPAIAVAVSNKFSRRGPEFDRSARLVVAAWKNGRMIWSDDAVQGGAPYRQGRTQPEKIRALLDQLDRKGVFSADRPYWRSWGPDAAFTLIGVQDGTRRLRMESWHELYEAKGRVVATAGGLTALNGRNINDVLAEQPAEYREKRGVWQEIRETLDDAIPAESEPVEDVDTKQWDLDDFGDP